MVSDPSEVPSVTGVLKAWESLAIILYLVIVGAGVGPLFTRDGPSGEVDLARVGQVVAVVVGAPLMVLGMFRYLGRRPALQELPEGRSLWTIGFYRVAATVKTLRTEFRTLGCFYLGYAFWESSNTAVVSLTGAYVLEQLGMTAGQFIIIALLFVVCAIPGALASIKIADKEWLSLKSSVAGSLVLSSVCLFFVCAFVHSSETRGIIYAVVPFLGFANGWVYPAQRNLLVALIPGGCEAEMMGFFQFSAMSLSWAPSLVFLAMGESTGDYRFAILVLPIFWLGGLAVLYFTVDLDTGLAEVAATLDKRFKSGTAAAPAAAPKAAPEKA